MDITKALLIKRYRLSEKSWVLIWMTEKYGKLKTAWRSNISSCKRKAGSPASSQQLHQQLFLESEISITHPRREGNEDLFFLKEATPLVLQEGLLPGYGPLLMASYFTQLMEVCTAWQDPFPEGFDLLVRALDFLKREQPNEKALLFFEKELARLLGVYDPKLGGYYSLSLIQERLPSSRKDLLEHLKKTCSCL